MSGPTEEQLQQIIAESQIYLEEMGAQVKEALDETESLKKENELLKKRLKCEKYFQAVLINYTKVLINEIGAVNKAAKRLEEIIHDMNTPDEE